MPNINHNRDNHVERPGFPGRFFVPLNGSEADHDVLVKAASVERERNSLGNLLSGTRESRAHRNLIIPGGQLNGVRRSSPLAVVLERRAGARLRHCRL